MWHQNARWSNDANILMQQRPTLLEILLDENVASKRVVVKRCQRFGNILDSCEYTATQTFKIVTKANLS